MALIATYKAKLSALFAAEDRLVLPICKVAHAKVNSEFGDNQTTNVSARVLTFLQPWLMMTLRHRLVTRIAYPLFLKHALQASISIKTLRFVWLTVIAKKLVFVVAKEISSVTTPPHSKNVSALMSTVPLVAIAIRIARTVL